MKLLRPLTGYSLYDHKTNDSVSRELQTECLLDKIDEYRWNGLLHFQRMPPNRIPLNHITTDHKEEEQLEDRRNVDENSCKFGFMVPGISCNSGDGTDKRVQSLMFMMMIMYLQEVVNLKHFYQLQFS
jgi:hypothetical protein